MLFLKPHTATRFKATENISPSTLEVRGVYYHEPATMMGQLTPMAANVAFSAEGVEIQRAHQWLWDSADDFEVNDLVKIGARVFIVAKPQMIRDAEPITAHREVVLEEIDAELAQASHPDL